MVNHYFDIVVQTDTFAALSAVIAFWLWILTLGMAAFCIQHKYRYTHWFEITTKERADACLNLGCFCFFAYAAFQRTLATWEFANAQWKLTKITAFIAPAYLPLALVGLSLVLWWLCFHQYKNYRRWWCNYMWTGIAIFAIIKYVF